MPKAILMMLMAFVSNNAVAKWIAASVSEPGTTCIDTATIPRAGDKVKMWAVMDYKIVVLRNNSRHGFEGVARL